MNRAVLFALITVFIEAVGLSIIDPVVPSLILELTGQGIETAAVYGGALTFVFGYILGPVIAGLLSEWGSPAPFFAGAALALPNMIYGGVVMPESLPPLNRRPFDLHRVNPFGSLKPIRRYPASPSSSL